MKNALFSGYSPISKNTLGSRGRTCVRPGTQLTAQSSSSHCTRSLFHQSADRVCAAKERARERTCQRCIPRIPRITHIHCATYSSLHVSPTYTTYSSTIRAKGKRAVKGEGRKKEVVNAYITLWYSVIDTKKRFSPEFCGLCTLWSPYKTHGKQT